MSHLVENALRMLGILIVEESGRLKKGDLRRRMKLSRGEFDQAYLFLERGDTSAEQFVVTGEAAGWSPLV